MQQKAKILTNQALAPDFYYMEIAAPAVAEKAVPGQFIHIKVNEGLDPFLRRPMSLHEIDRDQGLIGILYQVKGKGTHILSKRKAHSDLDIMGPLGKGFTLDFPGGHGVIVGGGMGIAPLYTLARGLQNKEKKVTLILGARSAEMLLRTKEFQNLGHRVILATDDGSLGQEGTVAAILKEFVQHEEVDFLYACGREPMLCQVKEVCQKKGINGEVSMEAYMGCGVGACLSCSCAWSSEKTKDLRNGLKYAKVCVDGPVFAFGEVVLNDS